MARNQTYRHIADAYRVMPIAPAQNRPVAKQPTVLKKPQSPRRLMAGVSSQLHSLSIKDTSSISARRALAKFISWREISNPHFCNTWIEATLSLAARA